MAAPAATASAKSLVRKLLLHSPSQLSPFRFSISTAATKATCSKLASKNKGNRENKQKAELLLKRRTRSGRQLDEYGFSTQFGKENSNHVPVWLGEVLDVFASASLKAEDIVNTWPDSELGHILRDYGEESNWFSLQNKIVKARSTVTNELVNLIRTSTSWTRGGKHGWIKTATRVFQALRIAVNDELNTSRDSIHSCFDSLAPGGRLAFISFHSLEDRIVKQTFLNITNCSQESGEEEEAECSIFPSKTESLWEKLNMDKADSARKACSYSDKEAHHTVRVRGETEPKT